MEFPAIKVRHLATQFKIQLLNNKPIKIVNKLFFRSYFSTQNKIKSNAVKNITIFPI